MWNLQPRTGLVFLSLPILIIPFIIGLLDDLVHLKPSAKLIAQWITASLLFLILNVRIISFYGFFDSADFPPLISYLVTVITVVVITNSLNLIDGIDGLAASFSLVACLFFGTWFLFTARYPDALVCLALAGGILAFLFQNWEPSKIFMGDTGSLVIGTVLSIVMIRFVNENYGLDQNDPYRFKSSVVTAICAMIIPLVDTTRIIIIRLSKGISPLTADKRHIHHGLIRLGLTHQKAVYLLTFVHVSMIGIAILFRNANEIFLFALILIASTALCLWLDRALINSIRGQDASGSKPGAS